MTTNTARLSKVERFIASELRDHVLDGDELLHFAHLSPFLRHRRGLASFREAAKAHAFLAAVGRSAIYLIETRVGAFGPLLENQGVVTLRPGDHRLVATEDGALRFERAGEDDINVQFRESKRVPSQRGFFRVVARYHDLDLRPVRKKRQDTRFLVLLGLGAGIAAAIYSAFLLPL